MNILPTNWRTLPDAELEVLAEAATDALDRLENIPENEQLAEQLAADADELDEELEKRSIDDPRVRQALGLMGPGEELPT